MVKVALVCIASLCVGLSLSGAFAADACKIFDDIDGRYSLGNIAIGTAQTAFMTRSEAEECYSKSDIEGECVYANGSGILYDINLNGSIEQSTVGQARLDDSSVYHGLLIAGVKLGDTVDTVTQKLRFLPRDFPTWSFTAWSADSHAALTTGNCLRSKGGSVWSYVLEFSDGRLSGAVAMQKGYESSAW
ncbi:MAG: hypothetical protein E6Q98_18750 [Rhodospirillaceae bacterium]|nr:MAG: hypothetical protein E6Q98_18750 [Rhodospirillaceae bacterium]